MTSNVRVDIGKERLDGDLDVPENARGIVVFAHGSGSSRHSPRNRYVAARLAALGFATLLIDLLTPQEEAIDQRSGHLRFDIDLLARRLLTILEWLRSRSDVGQLPAGLFGASTGGGAALVAAALRPHLVAAVVSRGGRPDLAGPSLARVLAPTLLIVGGHDEQVIELNRQAMARMAATTSLQVVPGATHLFEEPGALEAVATAAGKWFERYLPAAIPAGSANIRVGKSTNEL